MRYQAAALVIGVLTLAVLTGLAILVATNLARDDDARREAAAEAELRAFTAALDAHAGALRAQATALLRDPAVVDFAARGGAVPDALTFGPISRGGADYLLVSGPGRRLVHEGGLTDSLLAGGEDSTDEAVFLLDGAVDGGIFDFTDGPVLIAGARTGEGTGAAAVALGVRLTPEVLDAIAAPGRAIALTWREPVGAPPSVPAVEVVEGRGGRSTVSGPVDRARAPRPLLVSIDLPAAALPEPAASVAGRWLIALAVAGAAGVVALGAVVRAIASGVDELRGGLVAAQEMGGDPAVLDTLSTHDEVGRAAVQAAATVRALRERMAGAVDEARVATARQLLGEHVIRSMHEGVLVERSDGTCIVCNPAAATLLEVEPRALLGARSGLRGVLGDDLYPRLRERARQRDTAQRLEVATLAGRDLAFDAYAVPEHRADHEQEASSLLVIVRDVSAVLEVEQLKRDIVSVVSHELRTPITVVALSLELLGEPDADRVELLAQANRNVVRMREVVDELLDLARLESGQAEPEIEPTDVAALCRDVVEALAAQARERSITLREAQDGAIPQSIACDPRQIARAVTNLVGNAIKFSPPGSDVWLILRNGGDRLHIDVADSGPGIPFDEQERVFTRFYRATNVRDSVAGTGLGLPIVRQIAELHGGSAEALPAGSGAYVRLSLPVS